jgi:predicted TIM-barrel fold metal-dependent hydrolase
MIIDCHTHIFEAGRGGPFDLPCSAEDLLREMDEHNVDISVVLPLGGIAGNEFVHRQCAASSGRLIGLYNPDFERPQETIRKMEAFFESHSPQGLKIHPRHQNVSVNQTIVREALFWAAEHDVPVLFDVFSFGPSLDDPSLRPLAYHRLAQEMPRLRMVLAHAGGHNVLEAFMAAKANPNVHLDISFTPAYFRGSSVAQDCGFVCRRLPPGRVLYGSDFPYVPFGESLATARALLDSAEPAVVAEVFGGAAARLFNLSA